MELSDETLADLMTDANVIALVGVISDPQTEGFRCAAYQQSQGYQVIPVTREPDMIIGHRAVQSVSDIEGNVDIIDVFGYHQNISDVIEAAIRGGAKVIWFEPGSVDPLAKKHALEAGLAVVSNKSFEQEHRRLLSTRMQ